MEREYNGNNTFHPDYHGQGYATEAAEALLKFLFGDLAAHRVTSGCDARNTASVRLMERLGLRREGHLVQSQFSNGELRDEYLYALLRGEWLARAEMKAGKP
ncbi:MAG: hypothetical protein JWQ02_2721 [Capsulimonas sp.]|nr:hypothetical protein [Capsulimonas sp.]